MPHADSVKRKQYNSKYVKCNPEVVRERDRRKRIRLRIKAIELYGGRCAFCGTTQYEHLTIDHIEGGGTKHRTEFHKKYSSIQEVLCYTEYRPDLYRVLCWNCHMALTNHNVQPGGSELHDMAYWKEYSAPRKEWTRT